VKLTVVILVVIVVLVLFNLPTLRALVPGAPATTPTGTSPQPARTVAGGGGGALVNP
jgi:hypothetical protein